MKSKPKLIAAAAVLAVSGSAHALISGGADGNGELFFSAWDGASSYSRDLNITINGFEALIAESGALNLTFAADALFLDWLGTANVDNLYWAITANDNVGAIRLIETYTEGASRTVKGSDVVRSNAVLTQQFVADLNTKLQSADSATYDFGTVGYAGNNAKYGINSNDLLGFDRRGTAASNSYANGLSMLRIDAARSGVSLATYTPYLDGGFAVRMYLDTTTGSATYGRLTIAAVPEPESYAMLLAGLGVMGAIARRRSRG